MNKGNAGSLIGLTLFVSLFFLGFWYVSANAQNTSIPIETEINETEIYEFDSNWFDDNVQRNYSDSLNISNDKEEIWISPGSKGTWESKNINSSNYSLGIPERLEIISDTNSGTLEANITTYEYDGNISESYTYLIDESVEEINTGNNFSSQDVAKLNVDLEFNETENIEDQSPKVYSFELDVMKSSRTEKVGLTSDNFYIMTMTVFGMVGVLFVARYFG